MKSFILAVVAVLGLASLQEVNAQVIVSNRGNVAVVGSGGVVVANRNVAFINGGFFRSRGFRQNVVFVDSGFRNFNRNEVLFLNSGVGCSHGAQVVDVGGGFVRTQPIIVSGGARQFLIVR